MQFGDLLATCWWFHDIPMKSLYMLMECWWVIMITCSQMFLCPSHSNLHGFFRDFPTLFPTFFPQIPMFFLRWSVPPWSVWAAASPFWPTQVGGGRHWLLILVTSDMVDGRNPAPVDRWFIPLFIGFEPSKVLQDFFHPQYLYSYPKHC